MQTANRQTNDRHDDDRHPTRLDSTRLSDAMRCMAWHSGSVAHALACSCMHTHARKHVDGGRARLPLLSLLLLLPVLLLLQLCVHRFGPSRCLSVCRSFRLVPNPIESTAASPSRTHSLTR